MPSEGSGGSGRASARSWAARAAGGSAAPPLCSGSGPAAAAGVPEDGERREGVVEVVEV